jgi:GNAT superfamily N-acetyltransferase
MRDGESLSNLLIVPVTIRVGVATVRVDGIGEVGTAPQQRGRGYARRLITAAIAHMAAGDGALSMLYGIPGFYPQFGYATAGPQYTLSLPLAGSMPPLAPGWQARPAQPADLPAIQRLYDRETANGVGAVVRSPHHYPWTKLAQFSPAALAQECRVVVAPGGDMAAYAWRDRESWFTGHVGEDHPHSLIVAEVVARDAPAAEAILAVCREWAREEGQADGRRLTAVTLAIPPEGPVAAAARYRTATFQQTYSADSESMVRTLHPGRLLQALAPELERRLRAALPTFQGTLLLETELGSVALHVAPGRLDVADGQGVLGSRARAPGQERAVHVPQMDLARLALGAFGAADLLARLERPPAGAAHTLIEALFPPRHPHVSIPDRF